MTNLGLSPEEENQLKTITEYLFFDEFKEKLFKGEKYYNYLD